MSINATSDYAIRILLYLAANGGQERTVSGKEISGEMRIPYNYFLKIIPNLKNADIIQSYQGKKGGYSLKVDPEEISLFQILEVMDDRVILNQCLKDPNACSRRATGYCAVHRSLEGLQEHIDQELSKVTVADLVDKQKEIDIEDGRA